MKILMLSSYFPPSVGGIETHVYELSKELVKQGHQVTVIARNETEYCTKHVAENVEGINVLWLSNYEQEGTPANSKIVNSPKYWMPVIKAWYTGIKLALQQDFDVVHAHSVVPIAMIGAVVALLKRKPLVVTVHESQFLYGMENKYYRFIARHTLRRAKDIIAVSKELYMSASVITSRNDVKYIPNGVDVCKFTPHFVPITQRKFPMNRKIVLCARRLDAEKNGVKYLLKAIPLVLKEYAQVLFVFVGNGLSQVQINRQLRNCKEHIKLVGSVPNKDMPAYYNEAHIVVLPSLYEATSIAGLEAMACGKILVGTNVGGIPELIAENDTGFLCEPKNPKSLATALIKALNTDTYSGIGARAILKVFDKYTWTLIAKHTLEVYNDKHNYNIEDEIGLQELV